ncbi:MULTISPECIES: hypothetical protein [unclassified Mycobacterium]|uniref:hypothetical protein n=1 Tax=unclassified Mycobacterium TaxID=2642494 RepID=UPI00089A3083|nr:MULTISPECIES: hypothetical protein [unclassified Mycobacterium]SEB22276.1 hypothetical protein SAMN04488580_111240 [Mycobacterium sp. 283mftsu]
MTQPPQSGPWGAQPPQQPGNWQGYPGGQPGPGPQGHWNPQQQWPNPAPAPQKKGPLKWVLGAIALIAVIAATAVVAVSCAGGKGSDNGGGGTPTSGSKSDIASAHDTGPVSVITEDPSCAPWGPINDTLANVEKNGWDKRDASIPASAWNPDMQAMYRQIGDALRNSADQTVPLVKLTQHRVMRELYQQYIAYTRAFVERIPSYTENDKYLQSTGVIFGMVISNICQAITFGSAGARGPLVESSGTPQQLSPVGDLSQPTKFLTSPTSDCSEWNSLVDGFVTDPAYVAWNKEDPSIPASNWSPEYKAENDALKPVITHIIDAAEKLGHASKNPTVADLAALSGQYGRAFIQGVPTYTSADLYLFNVWWRGFGAISAACKAAGAD